MPTLGSLTELLDLEQDARLLLKVPYIDAKLLPIRKGRPSAASRATS